LRTFLRRRSIRTVAGGAGDGLPAPLHAFAPLAPAVPSNRRAQRSIDRIGGSLYALSRQHQAAPEAAEVFSDEVKLAEPGFGQETRRSLSFLPAEEMVHDRSEEHTSEIQSHSF